jgi:hypothetical protein
MQAAWGKPWAALFWKFARTDRTPVIRLYAEIDQLQAILLKLFGARSLELRGLMLFCNILGWRENSRTLYLN